MFPFAMVPNYRKFGPVGQCIYCGDEDGPLRIEHIIPYSLGGGLLLSGSSCDACGAETGKVETHISHAMWGNMRMKANFPTRNRRERPDEVRVTIVKVGQEETVHLPIEKAPVLVPMIWLPQPNILSGGPADGVYSATTRFFWSPGIKPQELGGEEVKFAGQFDLMKYARFLAKIAHGFAVLHLGVDGFEPVLNGSILGKSEAQPLQYVGGDLALIPPTQPVTSSTHEAGLGYVNDPQGNRWLCVSLRLFAGWLHNDGEFGTPRYLILVGKPNALTPERFGAIPPYPEYR